MADGASSSCHRKRGVQEHCGTWASRRPPRCKSKVIVPQIVTRLGGTGRNAAESGGTPDSNAFDDKCLFFGQNERLAAFSRRGFDSRRLHHRNEFEPPNTLTSALVPRARLPVPVPHEGGRRANEQTVTSLERLRASCLSSHDQRRKRSPRTRSTAASITCSDTSYPSTRIDC